MYTYIYIYCHYDDHYDEGCYIYIYIYITIVMVTMMMRDGCGNGRSMVMFIFIFFFEDSLWLKDLVRSTCLYHECLIEITTKSVACHPGIHFSFGSFLIESETHKEWVKIQDHHERLLKDHVENPRSYQGHILGKKKSCDLFRSQMAWMLPLGSFFGQWD